MSRRRRSAFSVHRSKQKIKDVVFALSHSQVCNEETSSGGGCMESFASRESAMFEEEIESKT